MNNPSPSFLQRVASHLYNQFGSDMSEVTIVFPGQRAGFFLRKELANISGKALWSPEILTIDTFVFSLAALHHADEIQLTFELFQICKTNNHDETLRFTDFLGWSSVLLSDFNDADMYLANPEQLFCNIVEAKKTGLWEPGKKSLTEFEQQYIAFYDKLLPWYTAFRDNLYAKNIAYPGMAYRHVAEHLDLLKEHYSQKTLIIAGFNAFTPAEERIATALKKADLADFLWDIDSYMLDNRQQEAGSFFRAWFKKNPEKEPQWITEDLTTTEKTIHIISAGGDKGQAIVAGRILGKENPVMHDINSAVILPDESLLIPFLHTLPENIHNVNITMGYPLSHTSAGSWLTHYNNLFSHNITSSRNNWHRTRDVIPVIEHTWFKLLAGPGIEESLKHFNEHIKYKSRFVEVETLIKVFDTLDDPALFFSPPGSTIGLLERIMQQAKLLIARLGNNNTFEQEVITEMYRIVVLTRSYLAESKIDSEPSALNFIIKRLLHQTKIPFSGEPLQGLQVMGVLETRNIDFENLIVLSVNEGIFPPGKKNLTFIPADLRYGFQLPGWNERDAVAAYHFYHLLQRAKNIWLVYNTDTTLSLKGEKSRFVRQIENELVNEANNNINIVFHQYNEPAPVIKEEKLLSIQKDATVMNGIRAKAKQGFSPSTLINYLHCPLKFYFETISGIRSVDEPEDTIDSRELGNVIHNTLEKLFAPYLNETLSAAIINTMISKSNDYLNDEFEQIFGSRGLMAGKNMLIYEMAKYLIERFLKSEKETLKTNTISLISLEKKTVTTIEIDTENGKEEITIKGKADRIDIFNDTVRIIDYKTGKVDSSEVSIKALLESKEKEKAFQLLTYLWLFRKTKIISDDAVAGIISMVKHDSMYVPLMADKKVLLYDSECADTFEGILFGLLKEIFDTTKPFEPTDNENICRYCNFQSVCSK